MKDRYIYPSIFSFDDDGISVEFPDLPGCFTCASPGDEEDAFASAREALQLHLYAMEKDNDDIPTPSKLTALNVDKNQVIVMIDVWMPAFREKMMNKSVNKMVTLPKWLLELAEKEKVNFSQTLQSALKERLGVYDYQQIEK